MADNYLERRMEDLRSGKVSQTYRANGKVARRTGMYFPFPPRRVLIATVDPRSEVIAQTFLRADCKVAVMADDSVNEKFRCSSEGIRRYPSDPSLLADLLKAWRDIDILIADSDMAFPLVKIWQKHRECYPYVSDYVCRIIIFGDVMPSAETCSEWETSLKATVNIIDSKDLSNDITGLVVMLTLSSNGFISRMVFEG